MMLINGSILGFEYLLLTVIIGFYFLMFKYNKMLSGYGEDFMYLNIYLFNG